MKKLKTNIIDAQRKSTNLGGEQEHIDGCVICELLNDLLPLWQLSDRTI